MGQWLSPDNSFCVPRRRSSHAGPYCLPPPMTRRSSSVWVSWAFSRTLIWRASGTTARAFWAHPRQKIGSRACPRPKEIMFFLEIALIALVDFSGRLALVPERIRAKGTCGRGLDFRGWSRVVSIGGAEGNRTPDLCSAIAALSHLSYGPALGAGI